MKKILIIQTASIGDVILATSLLESLHAKFPEASLDILVKKGNESLFSGHPFLRNVITWDKRKGKFSSLAGLIKVIRRTRYDLVVNVQRFFSSGLITVFSGARETRGFNKNPLSFLFSRRFDHKIGDGTHEIFRNNSLVADLIGKIPSRPGLYPMTEDQDYTGRLIMGTSYTIFPASLWHTKQYPVEKWVELISNIPANCIIFLLGGASDSSMCEEIKTRSQHPGLVSLAGELSLLQSAALMKRCRMNFTNDSAPLHLAAAVDAPVTAIFCSTVPGFGFGPLSTNSMVVQTDENLSCRPCGLHGHEACPEKHFRCANGIDTRKLVARL